jgi:hypothetical protein
VTNTDFYRDAGLALKAINHRKTAMLAFRRYVISLGPTNQVQPNPLLLADDVSTM